MALKPLSNSRLLLSWHNTYKRPEFPKDQKEEPSMTRGTALTGVCLVACLGLPSVVLAQYDPFDFDTHDPGESYRRSMDEYYERRNR